MNTDPGHAHGNPAGPPAPAASLKRRLRILFECLCAFVVRKDEVLVVVPDGRRGCPPMPGGAHPMLPPHVAAIQFDPAELSAGSELTPHCYYRRPGGKREQALLFLSGADLALDPAPTGLPGIASGRKPGEKVPTSPAEALDFDWIAAVAALDAGAGVIDPACAAPGTNASLSGKPTDPGRVIARMPLRGGTLTSVVLGLDTSQDYLPFDFVDPKTKQKHGYRQALTSVVAYDVEIAGDLAALVLTPFGEKTGQRLELSFAGLPLGYTAQVMVKNMPLDSILEVSDDVLPGQELTVDEHFAMYYALSKTPPATPWIPHGAKARAGGPICPMARFVE